MEWGSFRPSAIAGNVFDEFLPDLWRYDPLHALSKKSYDIFPVLETLSFYDIFPVLETLSFYDISVVLETLSFYHISPVLETLNFYDIFPYALNVVDLKILCARSSELNGFMR